MVDTGNAVLEAEGASADPIHSAAYQHAIGGLLESRRVFQRSLCSLDTPTVDQFGFILDSMSVQLDTLDLRVYRARFELAPDVDALMEVALSRLAAVMVETEELRAGANSTLEAVLTFLKQRGAALGEASSATSDMNPNDLRRTVVADLRGLRRTLDSPRTEPAARSS